MKVNTFHSSIYPINPVSRQKIYLPLGMEAIFLYIISVMLAIIPIMKIKGNVLEEYIWHAGYYFIQISSYFTSTEEMNRTNIIRWKSKWYFFLPLSLSFLKGFMTPGFWYYFLSELETICCHVFFSDFCSSYVVKGNELVRLISTALKLSSRWCLQIWGFENYLLLPWFFTYS